MPRVDADGLEPPPTVSRVDVDGPPVSVLRAASPAASAFFRNKKVLLTGHSSGLGRALCLELLAAGASVIGLSRSPLSIVDHGDACVGNVDTNAAANAQSPPASRLWSIPCDLTQPAQIRKALQKIQDPTQHPPAHHPAEPQSHSPAHHPAQPQSQSPAHHPAEPQSHSPAHHPKKHQRPLLPLDIVIHCAGIGQRSSVAQTDMEVHQRIMDVNFFAMILLYKLTLPLLRQAQPTPQQPTPQRPTQQQPTQQTKQTNPPQQPCQWVAISSVQALLPMPMRATYAASKFALEGFLLSAHLENIMQGLEHPMKKQPAQKHPTKHASQPHPAQKHPTKHTSHPHPAQHSHPAPSQKRAVQICLCRLGFVATSFSKNALQADGTAYAKEDKTTTTGMTPEKVAQRILQGIAKKKKILLIAGMKERMGIFLYRYLPWLFDLLIPRIIRKIRKG